MEDKDVKFLQTVFDNRYRKVDDCNDIMATTDKREDDIEKALIQGMTKLNILIGILSTIAVPIIGMCIKYLFGE